MASISDQTMQLTTLMVFNISYLLPPRRMPTTGQYFYMKGERMMRIEKKVCSDCKQNKFDSKYSREFECVICDLCFNKRYRIMQLFDPKNKQKYKV